MGPPFSVQCDLFPTISLIKSEVYIIYTKGIPSDKDFASHSYKGFHWAVFRKVKISWQKTNCPRKAIQNSFTIKDLETLITAKTQNSTTQCKSGLHTELKRLQSEKPILWKSHINSYLLFLVLIDAENEKFNSQQTWKLYFVALYNMMLTP